MYYRLSPSFVRHPLYHLLKRHSQILTQLAGIILRVGWDTFGPG